MKQYDAIIIGSGQAGTPLVFKMAAKGQKVAFIEREHVGGTCLNVGCTPTKTYVASARRMWDANHGDELGIEIQPGAKANLKSIKARKDALIAKSVNGILTGLRNNKNIDFYKGEARFIGHKTLEVNNEQLIAEKIFINVGARSFIPKDFETIHYLDNQSILELEEIPEHLIIVGGSYIGLEFGQIFRRLGSRVTIIEREKTIIGSEDKDVSDTILQFLINEGIQFRLNVTCLSGENNPSGGVTVHVDCINGDPSITGSHLLLAVGRTPNTDTLNLEATGVKTNDRNFIEVNDLLETNVVGIYALGDCNGKGAFTHTAYNDFEILAENMLEGKNRKISDRIITYGLFIDPPLGRAGLTLDQARKTGRKLKVGYRKMEDIARAREKGETEGFMRIIVDAESNKILGASVLGVGGDEIISSILNMMYAEAPYQVIRDSVLPYPTVSELIPTMLKGLKDDTEI
jgi:pyruvate/2-oxoglutarate dehydrogenase complex dihydrolipoamide dehydrogenase (E3) component